jgi:O-antigen/teichoic acid export membrane protein
MKRPLAFVHAVLAARGGVFAMVQTGIAQGLTMGVNVATGIITARLLGPIGRGEFAAASFWLLLPSLLATAGLQNAVIYGARRTPGEASGIAAAGLAASTFVFLPMLAACMWLLPYVMHAYTNHIIAVGRIALLLSAANIWMTMLRQWLIGTQRFGLFNTLVYGVALAYLGLLLLLAACGAVTPASATYAQIGSTILGLLVLTPLMMSDLKHAPIRHVARHLRAVLDYGGRAAAIDVVTVLSQNIDRLVLVVLIPAAEFGLYVVALSFARILMILQTAVSAVLLADLAGRSHEDIAAVTRNCFRLLLWILLAVCAAILAVDGRLLRVVYGADFAGAVPVFRVLLLDAALSCLAQVLIQAFLARNASGVASTVQIVCFAVTAAGVLALAPRMGSIGAAAALAGGSLLRLGLLLASLRQIGIQVPNVLPRRSELAMVLRRANRPAAAILR